MDGGVLYVRGTDGADNLEVRYIDNGGGGAIAVHEQFKSVDAGAGCSADSDGSAVCPYAGTSSVQVDLGTGDDELYADPGVPLRATGGTGDDRLFMRSGLSPWESAPATLDGGAGDDRIGGGLGDDTLLGGPGQDGIEGAEGDDHIDPGPGEDSVSDRVGDDTISARDGSVDQVNCGAGTDTGDFDPFDVASGCELGNLPTRAAPDCTPEIDPVSSIAYSTLRRARAFSFRATVEAGCTMRARIATSSGVVLAATTAAAHRGTVRIRLSARALSRIRRARRFTVRIQSTAPGSVSVRRSFRVRLR